MLSEAVRSTPSVVYLPRLDSLWTYLAGRLGMREPLLDLLRDLPRRAPLLLLATCDTEPDTRRVPAEVAALFSAARRQLLVVDEPSVEQRRQLFTRLFMKRAIMLKKRKSKNGRCPGSLVEEPLTAGEMLMDVNFQSAKQSAAALL